MDNEQDEIWRCKPYPQVSGAYLCRRSSQSDKAAAGRESQKDSAATEHLETPEATPPESLIETWVRVDGGQKVSLKVQKVSMGGKELYEVIKPSEIPELKATDVPPLSDPQLNGVGMKHRLARVNGCDIRHRVASRLPTKQQVKTNNQRDGTVGEGR